jgi:hypothetical protein
VAPVPHYLGSLILKIQYFPSEFFLIKKISKKSIISVEAAKEVVGYTLCSNENAICKRRVSPSQTCCKVFLDEV